MPEEILIEVNNLTKSFGKIKAVDGLNMKVMRGDIYGFLGPNGSGKTTTIRTILGLLSSDNGSITINGKNIKNNFKEYISNIGAIVETPTFYGYLSAYDNLKLIANLTPGIKSHRIIEVIELVGLKGRENDKVKTYSLGMRQRLGIAQALLPNPKLLILDEPTNGLDPHGMKEIRDIIRELANKGITFIISSHLINEIQQICNRVCIINKGNLIEEDYVNKLLISNNEIVDIHTADSQLVYNLLKNSSMVMEIVKNEKGVTVTVKAGMTAKINQFLVENNVSINYIIPKSSSLEALFFELTGGQLK